MANPIKAWVQNMLYNRCKGQYEAELERQSDRYAQFLLQRGEQTKLSQKTSDIEKDITNDTKQELIDGAWKETKETVVIYLENGMVDSKAFASLDLAMQERPELLVAYGQEDFVNKAGERHSPWFKPVWSPDTFETSFYMGSLIAVRKNVWEAWKTGREEERPVETYSYTELGRELVQKALEIARHSAMEGASQIVSQTISRDSAFWESHKKVIGLVDAFLYHGYLEKEACDSFLPKELPAREATNWEAAKQSNISVIIPSKDNPEVLQTCLRSLVEKTKFPEDATICEVIVVDNGSDEENRQKIAQLLAKLEQKQDSVVRKFRYEWHPMAFNFSKMCNIGVGYATGDFLLFLNDDMEILAGDWLAKMLVEAKKPWAGAIGAKLLYPGTTIIQHAGVTNLSVGPAHKLLKEDDSKVYYHGRNRGKQDMLAVTAACLLVDRQKYEAVGGFYEGMAVSYNDVDFCFSLYEKGWYNIQCNDVILYHHESLSRGDDNLSEEKWERLLKEKHTLYNRHPDLWKQDPFYSSHLAEHFSDYICSYEYAYEKRDCYTKVKSYKAQKRSGDMGRVKAEGEKQKYACPVPTEWNNNCLVVNVEHARKERKLDLTEEHEVYWIEGWSYVLNNDNLRYEKQLLLTGKKSGRTYEAQVLTRYREDVEQILPEQQNVALAGFVCRIPMEKLPADEYQIAMLVKDRCSSQRLYKETEVILDAAQ